MMTFPIPQIIRGQTFLNGVIKLSHLNSRTFNSCQLKFATQQCRTLSIVSNLQSGLTLKESKTSLKKKTSEESSKKKGAVSKFLDLPSDDQLTTYGPPEDWITVYRFPHIRLARAVQRFKIYQTVFSCAIAFPVSLVSYAYGSIGPEVLGAVSAFCISTCGFLYIMGNFFSRLVGIIYVTEKDPEVVRIAHMTFWGARKDEIFLRKDFVPFSDLNDRLNDTYVNLQQYSDPENKLHITLKYGEVHSPDKLQEIFGHSPDLIFRKKENGN